jgi:hypothetical protein
MMTVGASAGGFTKSQQYEGFRLLRLVLNIENTKAIANRWSFSSGSLLRLNAPGV